jgi:hypothetical protein
MESFKVKVSYRDVIGVDYMLKIDMDMEALCLVFQFTAIQPQAEVQSIQIKVDNEMIKSMVMVRKVRVTTIKQDDVPFIITNSGGHNWLLKWQ